MRPRLTEFVKLALAAIGLFVATYGTVGLNNRETTEGLTADPNFWMAVGGGLATVAAYESVRRRRPRATGAAGEATQSTVVNTAGNTAENAAGHPGDDGPDGAARAATLVGAPGQPPPAPGRGPASTPAGDDRHRLSLLEVVGLAAGGVIGSGWLLSAPEVHQQLGGNAFGGWLAGVVLMFAVAVPMVEFGLVSRRTGGLLFHPQDAFGPLVVIVLAGTLWISYAVNPVAQSAAAVRSLAEWVPGLAVHTGGRTEFTPAGSLLAVGVLTAIIAFVVLPKRFVLRANALLTVVKIAIPVVLVTCLAFAVTDAGVAAGVPEVPVSDASLANPLAALLASGIVYAYIGFQAPLDVTGEIRTGGRTSVNARVRWAVYGTIGGSFLLYTALQYVHDRHVAATTPSPGSPYAQIAQDATLAGASLDWLVPLVHLVSVASPIGSGIVFTYVLTREVFALAGERYVPQALRATWATRPGRLRYDAPWLILLVNLGVGLALLAAIGFSWLTLTVLNTIPILVLYSVTCVVLFVRADVFGDGVRRHLLSAVAFLAFVGVALAIHESDWERVWRGMTVIAVGTAVLLLLPWLARLRVPGFGWYDAQYHGAAFRSRAVSRPFWILTGYLAALAALSAVRHGVDPHDATLLWLLRGVLAVVSSAAFLSLVGTGQHRLAR